MIPLFHHSTIAISKYALILLISLLVACATGKVTYYKPGGDQYKFNLDSEECSERAKMIAQSQMVSPDAKPDSGLVQKYYTDCLYAKG